MMLPENPQDTNDATLERAIDAVVGPCRSSIPSSEVVSEILTAVQANVGSPNLVQRNQENNYSLIQKRKRRMTRMFHLSSLGAAVAILVGGFAIFSQTKQNTALAFEQVIENIKNTKSVTYCMAESVDEKFYCNGKDPYPGVTLYYCQGDQTRVEFYADKAKTELQGIVINTLESSINLNIREKTATTTPIKIVQKINNETAASKNQSNIEWLMALTKNDAELVSEDKLNGKKMQIYRLPHFKYPLKNKSLGKGESVKVWIDPETKLPVQIRMELYPATLMTPEYQGPEIKDHTMVLIYEDMKWNVPLKEDLFKIPEGYKEIVQTEDDLRKIDEDYRKSQEDNKKSIEKAQKNSTKKRSKK